MLTSILARRSSKCHSALRLPIYSSPQLYFQCSPKQDWACSVESCGIDRQSILERVQFAARIEKKARGTLALRAPFTASRFSTRESRAPPPSALPLNLSMRLSRTGSRSGAALQKEPAFEDS